MGRISVLSLSRWKITWKGTKWLLGQCLKNASFLRLPGIHKMYWNSVQSAKQERIFPPQTGPDMFSSAADSVSLGGVFFVPNVIRTGLKTIYKACRCSGHTTSRLSTTWQHLQIDVTGAIWAALWHPTLHVTSSTRNTDSCRIFCGHHDPCVLLK